MNIKRKSIPIAAVSLVAAGLVGHSLLSNGPNGSQVQLVAYFADSSPLVPGNVVKASGVDVGKVTSISLNHGEAQVTMVLDDVVLPLHRDLRATITTQDLLGERFITLDRGSASSPALSQPYVIDESHTARVVDLQDVLNSVNTPTAAALSALLEQSGEGIQGQGKSAAAAIAGLKPAMAGVNTLATVLSHQNALLTRLIDSTQPVATSLATDAGKPLDQLVASTTAALSAVASQREALRASLQQLPETIANSRAALAQLAGVADPATRTLAALRPATDNLKDISGELQRFSDAADPALASLPAVLNEADKLLQQASPVVAALRPAAANLVPAAASAMHLSDVALSGKSLTNLMNFVAGWSMATSDYDSISHYFKAIVPLSPAALGDTASGLLPVLPNNILHGLPVPTAPQLVLPPRTGGATKNPLLGLPLLSGSGQSSTSGSATGLSNTQETSLLAQLLGGL